MLIPAHLAAAVTNALSYSGILIPNKTLHGLIFMHVRFGLMDGRIIVRPLA